MAKRYNYNAEGKYRGYSTTTPPRSNEVDLGAILWIVGILGAFGLLISLFEQSTLLGCVCIFIALAIWIFVDERKRKKQEAVRVELEQKRHAEQIEQQRRHESALQEAENLRQELEQLRLMPSSSSNVILGRRIIRQIKMVVADNHRERDDAELAFLRQIKSAGGNAVINMRVRRHSGGYVSIHGDAVEI